MQTISSSGPQPAVGGSCIMSASVISVNPQRNAHIGLIKQSKAAGQSRDAVLELAGTAEQWISQCFFALLQSGVFFYF